MPLFTKFYFNLLYIGSDWRDFTTPCGGEGGEEYRKGWLLCRIIHKIPIIAEQALIKIKFPRNIYRISFNSQEKRKVTMYVSLVKASFASKKTMRDK